MWGVQKGVPWYTRHISRLMLPRVFRSLFPSFSFFSRFAACSFPSSRNDPSCIRSHPPWARNWITQGRRLRRRSDPFRPFPSAIVLGLPRLFCSFASLHSLSLSSLPSLPCSAFEGQVEKRGLEGGVDSSSHSSVLFSSFTRCVETAGELNDKYSWMALALVAGAIRVRDCLNNTISFTRVPFFIIHNSPFFYNNYYNSVEEPRNISLFCRYSWVALDTL